MNCSGSVSSECSLEIMWRRTERKTIKKKLDSSRGKWSKWVLRHLNSAVIVWHFFKHLSGPLIDWYFFYTVEIVILVIIMSGCSSAKSHFSSVYSNAFMWKLGSMLHKPFLGCIVHYYFVRKEGSIDGMQMWWFVFMRIQSMAHIGIFVLISRMVKVCRHVDWKRFGLCALTLVTSVTRLSRFFILIIYFFFLGDLWG